VEIKTFIIDTPKIVTDREKKYLGHGTNYCYVLTEKVQRPLNMHNFLWKVGGRRY